MTDTTPEAARTQANWVEIHTGQLNGVCSALRSLADQLDRLAAERDAERDEVALKTACIAGMSQAADKLAAERDAYKLDAERYAPYGIIDPDYARVYTQARIIAWQYGYACLLHGSFTRDLDLLMAPWTEQARGNGEQILKLIAQACNLRFKDGEEDILKAKADWSEKPHGRKSCSLYFPRFGDRRWIDVSFVPLTLAAGAREAQPPAWRKALIEWYDSGHENRDEFLELLGREAQPMTVE